MKKLIPAAALLLGLSVVAAEIKMKNPTVPSTSTNAVPPNCWPLPSCPPSK